MQALLADFQTTNPINPGNQWVLICLAGLTILYIAFIRPIRKGKAARDPLQRTPGQSNLVHQRAIEREMSNLLVEYEEMIRRMTAQVDTRAARLELLIREADEKIAALQSAGREASPASRHSGADAASGDGSPAPDDGAHASVADEPAPAPSPPDPLDQRRLEVYQLADAGQTARQIAQQLHQPDGEIELILKLRKRQA